MSFPIVLVIGLYNNSYYHQAMRNYKACVQAMLHRC